jgi:hypothetical protein
LNLFAVIENLFVVFHVLFAIFTCLFAKIPFLFAVGFKLLQSTALGNIFPGNELEHLGNIIELGECGGILGEMGGFQRL